MSISKNIFYQELGSRSPHLILIPSSLFLKILDILAGIPAATLAICTLGQIRTLNQFAKKQLHPIKTILSTPFCHLIETFNPHAEISCYAHNEKKVYHTAYQS